MKLNAEFTFDKAGQGLFYHGMINGDNQSFSVVYDCGTLQNIKGAKRNLSNVVSDYKMHYGCNNIGLLAISHFDFDHVSHIPELLSNIKVDTVMLPYLAEELRIVFLAKALHKLETNSNDEDVDTQSLTFLFSKPVAFFEEYGARQIIEIQSDDGDDMQSKNNYDDFPHKPKFHPNDAKPRIEYVTGGKVLEEKNDYRNYALYSGCPTFRVVINQLSWLFTPLNVREKLPTAFYNEVRDLLERYDNDWNEILSSKERIKQLTQLYDSFIGRGKRNAHSLLLRHEPEQYSCLRGTTHCFCKNHKCRMCCVCRNDCKECFIECGLRREKSTTVLLGDLELDGQAKSVLQDESFIRRDSKIILIPHHGANSDDVKWLDEQCNSEALLAVSYGTKNKWKHPQFMYDGTIADVRNRIIFVNEIKDFKYRIVSWS